MVLNLFSLFHLTDLKWVYFVRKIFHFLYKRETNRPIKTENMTLFFLKVSSTILFSLFLNILSNIFCAVDC